MAKKRLKTGAENVCWDLSCLYSGPNDPRIDADIGFLERLSKSFRAAYKGRLTERLGEAIRDFERIYGLMQKLLHYFLLAKSVDVNNEALKTKSALVDKAVNKIFGEFLEFFFIEASLLSKAKVNKLARLCPIVAQYRFWLEQMHLARAHLLKEDAEAAVTKRSSFGPDSWVDFFDEMEDALNYEGVEFREALRKYATQTLNVVVSGKAVEDGERGYASPMAERNEVNGLSDAVVNALHKTVWEEAAPLARRYYRLKKALLRKKELRWNERRGVPPLEGMKRIKPVPFSEARKIVLAAYGDFSPTLAGLIREMIKLRRIDASDRAGKVGGPYNCAVVQNRKSMSFVFLNYDGTHNDILTFAHELGHATKGILAGETQGSVLGDPPLALEETASAFDELLTFNYLKRKIIEGNNKQLLFRLLIEQIEESIETVVHQICLSVFERRIYEAKERFSVDELCALWIFNLKEFYGKEGYLFTYDGAVEALFDVYISQFYEPFYVYSYAFGELLTHGLYAQQERLGSRFEPLYLDLLRAGRSKPLSKLLEPFGIDLAKPQFWSKAIEISLGAMIKEVEELARELGYKIPK